MAEFPLECLLAFRFKFHVELMPILSMHPEQSAMVIRAQEYYTSILIGEPAVCYAVAYMMELEFILPVALVALAAAHVLDEGI